MSQDFLDTDILSDFIIESKEHLETIEPNLLTLEKEPDNLSILNEIFRPMHSLKGASGFLGLNRMNTLAHRAENILDELRKGSMSITSEIMDIILSATDALTQMIESLERDGTEGTVEISHLVTALDALMAGEAIAPTENAVVPGISGVPGTLAADRGTGQSAGPEQVLANSAPQAGECARSAGDVETWLENCAPKEPYVLTAFGEGHLRDFFEEAKDNTTSLSDLLLELEKNPENDELVNDLFRYFHNLKGNSGIIGYHELNSLTHEAETLLNGIRRHESQVTSPFIDLLLFVVDVLESLISHIDIVSGQVSPFDIEELLKKLQQAVAGGPAELPESLFSGHGGAGSATLETAENAGLGTMSGSTSSGEDVTIFAETVAQQTNLIDQALAGMRSDGENHEFADCMFRSLSIIQNACGFMGLDEIKMYAERTAGIVNTARSSGMDFSIMADLLEQECAIIRDMIAGAVADIRANAGDSLPSTTEASGVSGLLPGENGAGAETTGADLAKPAEPAVAAEAPPVAAESPAPGVGTASVSTLAPASAKPASAAKAEDNHTKTTSTIRVDHEKLDHLMNLIGELIINRNRYSMLARQLEAIEQIEMVTRVAQDLSETTYAMARISDDLQATIMKVRMVPVASVFSRFPRLVRDLSRKSGKEIELIMEGEDTELDKSVVEVIGDPLVHLIRNSVDHGIESEETRIQQGKPASGKVWLRAYYKGNSVTIEIEDDGKGIDPEKMREVGVRKGIITAEEAKLLDDREALDLIFAPGFSSAETITDISGRGVGMDVVRTNIKSLKGSINITSEVGKGSKITLSLPLTLAIIDALMVNIANEMFAIPLDVVSETTKIEAELLTDMKGRKALTLRGEVLGIVSLAEILGLPCKMHEQSILSVVVIQDNERRLGLVVDSLLERQEIVIKPLGNYLGDIQGISGATIMGDGSVILILEPHDVYTLATSRAV